MLPRHFGAAEDRRPIVGALQLEVGARHDVREVVLDAQRVVRGHLDVEADRHAAGGGRSRRQDRTAAAELEDVGVHFEAPGPDSRRGR